jgi:hypothetical protein
VITRAFEGVLDAERAVATATIDPMPAPDGRSHQ